MANDRSSWIRVSRNSPCPICGKPDNCERSADGTVVWCGRISKGSLRQNAGGQFLHRLESSSRPICTSPRPARQLRPLRDFTTLARNFAANADDARAELAQILGVCPLALTALGVGWSPADQFWTFPELDASGTVIGINVRHRNGDKRRFAGSRAGLTYASDWHHGERPILLVEGGSDTAALVGLKVNVIGRPSNCGGVELLSELLRDVPLQRQILVVGERDQKPDGRWPGREGAVRTAKRLCESLNREIGWCLPPDDAKDSRMWLNMQISCPAERLAALFLSGLESDFVAPPPRYQCQVPEGPIRTLDAWRKEMLSVRIASLTTPGYYLDSSPTGAGKSHVDLIAIQCLIAQEAA